MTITLGSLRITLFKFERLARFIPQIDQTQRTQQAQQIITSDYFQTIKQQAQAYKAGKV
jgi:hypothetical protein